MNAILLSLDFDVNAFEVAKNFGLVDTWRRGPAGHDHALLALNILSSLHSLSFLYLRRFVCK